MLMTHPSAVPTQVACGGVFRVSLLLLVALSVTGCQAPPKPPALPVKTAQTPLTGQDVSFTITEAGKKSWTLHADQVTYSPDQRLANLTGVTGQAYDKAEKPTASFSAPAGRYDQVSKWITLLNGVTAKSVGPKPVTLTAPTLSWKSNTPLATASGGVQINNQAFGKSTANTCQFSLDFTHIQLTGNASTTVQ
jgi:LPS export ABC transporter protein LptC